MFGESTPWVDTTGVGHHRVDAHWVGTLGRHRGSSELPVALAGFVSSCCDKHKTLMWGCLLPHLETGSLIKR
jgi:hypothetical protein